MTSRNVLLLTSLAREITLRSMKIEMRSLFGQLYFMFVAQINVMFMQPLYKANILCDCIINLFIFEAIIFSVLSVECQLTTINFSVSQTYFISYNGIIKFSQRFILAKISASQISRK